MISNVRITDVKSGADGAEQATVSSAFMVYRNRGLDEKDYMVGRRIDIVARQGGRWKLKRREVDLAQSVLLAKNLTTFF
jgi:3-phenylpropionate/cinnamic acid dioxygenase small subunit